MSNQESLPPIEEQKSEFNEEEKFIFNEEEQEFESNSNQESSSISLSISPTDGYEFNDDYYQITQLINNCRALLIDFTFDETTNRTISFKIPSSILPLSVKVANNFHKSPYLVECSFELDSNYPWSTKPNPFQATNPIYDRSFPGSIIMQNRVNHFFNSDYKPQERYRCQSYILAPQNGTNPPNFKELISELTKEGFTEKQSEKALQFCSYNIKKARDYF